MIPPVELIDYCRENMKQMVKKKIFSLAKTDKKATAESDRKEDIATPTDDNPATAPIELPIAPTEAVLLTIRLSIALVDFVTNTPSCCSTTSKLEEILDVQGINLDGIKKWI